ncbi:DeoR/GlpR family DNA-binding transcription regulator [Paenibacillus sp. BR2-3]|uniref:DeoR/GlpR family DNA-binding transcription regulator n=1 Tax=Paenibacillus sp. BR2-3 TaxID=3048494 RepID=UPI00397777FE
MKEKRLQYVEEYIHSVGTASLDEICERFHVSKNTVRRDVDRILEKGTIQKVYGGVTSISHNLVPFENRDHTNHPEKVALGKCAAQLIEDHDLIFIDSGTTTRNIIDFLPPLQQLTILTNSLDVINAAVNLDNVTLMTIGNRYKRKTKSFVSIDDLHILDKYNISKAFMAATGVSIASGLTNSDILEYEIKKRIAEKTQKMYLLADASKFGKSTMLTYAPLRECDAIITSKMLPEEYRVFCRDNNITLHICDET